MLNVKGWTGIIAALLMITGCVTVGDYPVSEDIPAARQEAGVYHKVRKDETLWRIAKVYGVSIEEIIAANNIPNVAYIEINQLLFIPDADEILSVPSPGSSLPSVLDSDPDSFVWPLKGRIITYFGERSRGRTLNGITIAASPGEKVLAARSGQVVFADYLTGYGYTVILDHADEYYSVYSRNSRLLVNLNERVQKREPLAEVGRTGDGAFLHFEIRKNSQPSNPLYYLPKN